MSLYQRVRRSRRARQLSANRDEKRSSNDLEVSSLFFFFLSHVPEDC